MLRNGVAQGEGDGRSASSSALWVAAVELLHYRRSAVLDEPTTLPGLRESGQIDLRMRRGIYQRDDLRTARGMIAAVIIGFLVISAAWVIAFLLA